MSDLELKKEINEDPEKKESSSTRRKISLKDIKEKLSKLPERIKVFFANPKKRLIFIICSGVFLILVVAIGLYFMTKDDSSTKTVSVEKTAKTEEEPKCEAVLNGAMTSCDTANNHPLAVIVENHPDARPQSGLSQADIIYEAIAEGGITRFMAIFGSNEVEKVGPVRSARTYFVDWAHGYDAYLAHVGGNMDALDQIRAEDTLDLDQFTYPSAYWRERQVGLASEHTMYTSTTKLRKQAKENGYFKANNFSLLKFKDEKNNGTENQETTTNTGEQTKEKDDSTDSAEKITVDFSNYKYKVAFDYDKKTNSYKRSMAGEKHFDSNTKKQIIPKNVIVMTVKRSPTVTRINEPGWNMTTVGSGNAQMFMDGKVIEGKWKKPSKGAREIFYDEAGKEVTFNRGQIWICVIPPDSSVSY